MVGDEVGASVGARIGASVDNRVGVSVGDRFGDWVGTIVGDPVARMVGAMVANGVGASVKSDGFNVGASAVGAIEMTISGSVVGDDVVSSSCVVDGAGVASDGDESSAWLTTLGCGARTVLGAAVMVGIVEPAYTVGDKVGFTETSSMEGMPRVKFGLASSVSVGRVSLESSEFVALGLLVTTTLITAMEKTRMQTPMAATIVLLREGR